MSDVIDDGLMESESNLCVVSAMRKKFRNEIVRLMLQELGNLGFEDTVKELEKESGLTVHSETILKFRDHILTGHWEEAIESLPELLQDPDLSLNKAKLLIYQQQFLELLEAKETLLAINCLRSQIASATSDQNLIQKLTRYIMCQDDLYARTKWDGSEGTSRQQLLHELNAFFKQATMVPESRLLILLNQARMMQLRNCLHHTTSKYRYTLLEDHICSRQSIPTQTLYILKDHKDEVWNLAFSNNGRYLASGSKDCSVIIWDAHRDYAIVHVLAQHDKPISSISWSPDDALLVTTSEDRLVRLWNPQSGELIKILQKHTGDITACVWHPDGKRFYTGGMDQKIYEWDVASKTPQLFGTQRAYCMAMSADGSYIVAVDGNKQITSISTSDRSILWTLGEVGGLTSLALSQDGRYLLASVKNAEIHLWDIEQRIIVRKYIGHKHGQWMLRSMFMGEGDVFIASGSEDAKVVIWNRKAGDIVQELLGHTASVNYVASNLHHPNILASASDDHTICIWGPSQEASAV
eukprot:TRINITY_DN3958_c0_g1_i4.p1 TRINITY_DN3958_c0_g1~~TRINITY_DN3958_c0_g1_i4.p1  ORF type:complete len:524 (+),score=94.61 TRINITY_DN3958_c0_g1_i4:295-1866(+)